MLATKHEPQDAFAPGWQDGAPRRQASELLSSIESVSVVRRLGRGEQIYGRDDPNDHWYRIVSGMARKSTLHSNGRRQIVDFLMPGEYFGFSACREHLFDVEAVVDGTIVACYPRRRVEALADSDPEIGRGLRQISFQSIGRLQARILILGHTWALEKVGAFLAEMVERSSADSNPTLVLLMSRYDIADYLSVSVETVSRALTVLRRRGSISFVNKHHIKILNPSALQC
jgi:CRP-like cAMP-binding protein